MKLVKLKVKNFRCYKSETEILIDDLTAIIGRNDIGKSAILDAINAFFNGVIDQGDLSTGGDDATVEITCVFEGLPSEVILDTAVPSAPGDEGILNDENQLEVKKTFTFGARTTKAVFLVASHYESPDLEDLLTLKNVALKQRAQELGVSLDDVDRRKNPPIRDCIRVHVGGGRSVRPIKVEGNLESDNNLKTIWGSLNKLLPIYTLFKCDKAFDEKDGDVKDPMQAAINEALRVEEIRTLLDQVEAKVKEFSTDVAERTIEKLRDFDESISESLRSEFSKAPSYGKVFDLTLLNEQNIPLNKRGSGIRRLVILSFFRAQAEKKKQEKDAPSIIYSIEEPETSQHPDHQLMIVDTLRELSEQDDVQVLFTTHCANLAREIPVHSLRFVSASDDAGVLIEYGKDMADGSDNDAVIGKIVKALGILPNPSDRVRVLVYVEGNHDVNALKRYSEILNRDDNAVVNLRTADNVGYVITGGSALKHYIEERHLEGLGKPTVHIYDNDVTEYRTHIRRINDEGNENKVGFNTVKLELECYLHQDAIAEAYAENGTVGVELAEVPDDNKVPYEVARKINSLGNGDWDELDDDRKKELARNKKNLLNTVAVEKMTVDRIRERGGYDEMRMWFAEIVRLSA